MPNSRKSNHMMMLAGAAIVSYWLLPIFVSGDTLQSVFNSLVFGVATAIIVTWAPAALFALRRDATGPNQSIVAVFTLWLVVWLQRLYAISFVALDRPGWLLLSALPAFMTYLFGVVGVLFLWAPASMEETSRSLYLRLTAAILVGAACAVASYYFQTQGI